MLKVSSDRLKTKLPFLELKMKQDRKVKQMEKDDFHENDHRIEAIYLKNTFFAFSRSFTLGYPVFRLKLGVATSFPVLDCANVFELKVSDVLPALLRFSGAERDPLTFTQFCFF